MEIFYNFNETLNLCRELVLPETYGKLIATEISIAPMVLWQAKDFATYLKLHISSEELRAIPEINLF